MLKSLIKLTFLLESCLLCLSLTACSSLLYYPTRYKYINEKLLDEKPTEVKIETKDDTTYAWYFENKKHLKKQPIVLFFHGNGQNLSAHFQSLYWILDEKLDFLIIDYPGYGKSSGEPSPKNTVETGVAAIRWLKKNYPDSSIAILAQSLGGPIALRSLIETKNEFTPCQITIESSFDSYQDMGKEVLKKSWATWIFQPLSYLLLSDKYSPADKLAELGQAPKLILHADNDPVVPAKMSQKLLQELPDPKELVIYADNTHAASFHSKDAQEARKKYLEEINKYCR